MVLLWHKIDCPCWITNDSVIDVIGKVREEEWKREIDFVMRSKGVLAEVSREKRVVRRRGMRGENWSLCAEWQERGGQNGTSVGVEKWKFNDLLFNCTTY